MTPDQSVAKTETDATAFSPRSFESTQSAAETIIGPYHLITLIGEGGMGQVWLAEQKQPVRRLVAIKLIKAGMNTREVVARFESERQALALMNHPAIAKVFDAESTPDGRPFFVMEYVVGIHITDYCDQQKLTMRQRLELFILVCEGVQHAHQKAIIHRDLKPSNILVTEVDGKPLPRIIDFGLAKAVSQGFDAETMFTQVGTVVGTLAYMSPEQAGLAGDDIDTRTDVYSLGVVLYELMVGALPLDFRKLTYYEVLRQLREQDAPRPSTRLRTQAGDSATTAQNRGADPPALTRQLRGDLDAIALKALEKDRALRYATPWELATDIKRHLRNEPVIAHASSSGYRARKYVRRHRLGVAVAAAAAVLLVGFAIAQAVELRRITRERDRADRISAFMTGMFKVSDPSEARGNSITAREILDKAAKEIDTALSNDPQLQSKMMFTMAGTYSGLGLERDDSKVHSSNLRARHSAARRWICCATTTYARCHLQHYGTREWADARVARAQPLPIAAVRNECVSLRACHATATVGLRDRAGPAWAARDQGLHARVSGSIESSTCADQRASSRDGPRGCGSCTGRSASHKG